MWSGYRPAGRAVEVEYWSTLTIRGRRDVAEEEEAVEKGGTFALLLADQTDCSVLGKRLSLSLPHQ